MSSQVSDPCCQWSSVTIQAFKKFCGNSAVSRTRRSAWPLGITLIFIQNSLNRRTHMAKVSESTPPRIFSMPAHSTFSLINRNLYISRRTRSRSLLATFGAPKILSFSKVRTFCFCFSTVSDVLQTSVGRSGGKPSSGRLSEAHTVGSVSSFRCLPSQDLPRIVVDCSRLSQRSAHGWVGVRLPVAVSLCIVLLILAYASALAKWHQILRYVPGGMSFNCAR